jgi:hypothetical protein
VIQIILPALVAIAVARAVRNKSGTRQPISPAMWVVIFKLIVVATTVCIAMALDLNRPALLAILAVLAMFCLPTLLVSPLLVRLRRPRVAYWSMRCCMSVHYAGNQHVGAMLYATLSATRMRDPSAACEWLKERFRAKPVNGVLGQTILGHLAAAQGDRVTAHCLFESIDVRPCPARQSLVRVTARDWLVMDAARGGDWFAAVRYAARGGSTSRWSRAVGGMARTIYRIGTPLPKWQLWLLWLVAPRRLRLRPLLQRALTAGVQEHESDIGAPRDLPAALAVFAEVLAKTVHSGEVSSSEFVAAVRWVTIRLESAETEVQVGRRLASLDATPSDGSDSVLSVFKSDVVKLILPVVAADPKLVAAGHDHPIIAETIRCLERTAFESIEMRAKDLARRAEKKHSLDILSEWQSWAILCDEANRLLTLRPGTKAALFEGVYRPLLSYAAFQHNDMQRLAFAQDIFRWLRTQAHAHGSPQVTVVLDKNIACYQPKD